MLKYEILAKREKYPSFGGCPASVKTVLLLSNSWFGFKNLLNYFLGEEQSSEFLL